MTRLSRKRINKRKRTYNKKYKGGVYNKEETECLVSKISQILDAIFSLIKINNIDLFKYEYDKIHKRGNRVNVLSLFENAKKLISEVNTTDYTKMFVLISQLQILRSELNSIVEKLTIQELKNYFEQFKIELQKLILLGREESHVWHNNIDKNVSLTPGDQCSSSTSNQNEQATAIEQNNIETQNFEKSQPTNPPAIVDAEQKNNPPAIVDAEQKNNPPAIVDAEQKNNSPAIVDAEQKNNSPTIVDEIPKPTNPSSIVTEDKINKSLRQSLETLEQYLKQRNEWLNNSGKDLDERNQQKIYHRAVNELEGFVFWAKNFLDTKLIKYLGNRSDYLKNKLDFITEIIIELEKCKSAFNACKDTNCSSLKDDIKRIETFIEDFNRVLEKVKLEKIELENESSQKSKQFALLVENTSNMSKKIKPYLNPSKWLSAIMWKGGNRTHKKRRKNKTRQKRNKK